MRQIGFGVKPVEKTAPPNMGYPQNQGKQGKPQEQNGGQTSFPAPAPSYFEQELEKQKAATTI